MPTISTKDCKFIMRSINRGIEYRDNCADQLMEELVGYINATSPTKTFARQLFNGKPAVINIPNIPRYITTNNSEVDDIDKFKLIRNNDMIRRLELHIGHVKINCEYTGYSHIALTVEFVPVPINNPEDEQFVDLPTTEDEEAAEERSLRKETSW